jgi:hypothetical protein
MNNCTYDNVFVYKLESKEPVHMMQTCFSMYYGGKIINTTRKEAKN